MDHYATTNIDGELPDIGHFDADISWSAEQMPFELIVSQHSSMVYSIAFNFFRDIGLAEDISQEAFLRLSMNLQSIKSQTHLALWLRRTTVRLCIDEHRKFSMRFATLDSAPEPASDHDDEDFLAQSRIRELVSGLPKLTRMALILRYTEDLSNGEIAEIMREPINTVKSRITRALETLRGKLPLISTITESSKDG